MKKKNTRKNILLIHRVLGLLTGVVIFIVSITGCLWVFKEEIESFYTDYKYVTPMDGELITASEVKKIAAKENPNREIHGVLYGKRGEAVEVIFYEADSEVYYQSLYINPYNGIPIKQVDHNAGFFGFVLKGHVRLWLPEAIGARIVSYSVLIFLFIIISGIVLWWPKKKKNWKQRLKFDWNNKTRWKRKNFDLHTVVGFYVSTLALVLVFTGCVMAFNWFYFIAYKATGGDKDPRFVIPNSETVQQGNVTNDYDQLIPMLYKKYDKAVGFELHYPTNDSTSIYIEVGNSDGLHYDADYLFFDQNTLKEIETNSIYGKYEKAKFADKLIRMNYDIHIGSIGGITGKIIAFLVSLLCASLPVSGILLWYGRKYKKTKQEKVAAIY